MEFDLTMREIKEELRSGLLFKRDMYSYLCQDFIELEKIFTLGQEMIERRDQIEIKILKAFSLNQDSKKIFIYASMFLDYFDLAQRKLSKFLDTDKSKLNKLKTNKFIEQIDLFHKNSCIVFVTLLRPLGQIKRMTSSFMKLFGMPLDEALNQSCNIIIPDSIAINHDR